MTYMDFSKTAPKTGAKNIILTMARYLIIILYVQTPSKQRKYYYTITHLSFNLFHCFFIRFKRKHSILHMFKNEFSEKKIRFELISNLHEYIIGDGFTNYFLIIMSREDLITSN